MNPKRATDETENGEGTVASALKGAPKSALAGIALSALGISIALIAGAIEARSLMPVATFVVMLGGVSVASGMFAGHGLSARRREDCDATPELLQAVDQLSGKAGIRAPAVRVIRCDHPDAYVRAIRGPLRLTVTRGLLDTYTHEALIGTIGHEIGHILAGHAYRMRRRLTATIAPILAALGALVTLSLPAGAISPDWTLTILAPVVATHLWCARTSRQHELEADQIGATLTGKTAALAALDHLAAHEHPPQHGPFARPAQLLSTHPCASARRAALQTATGDPAPGSFASGVDNEVALAIANDPTVPRNPVGPGA